MDNVDGAPVVVAGAGLAGLHAAHLLHEAGIEVVVLEARDRVGGRTWSHALADGTFVERGGEFISPHDDAIRGLCARLGLDLVPHGFPFDRRPTPDAPAPTAGELAAVMAAAHASLAASEDDRSGADALTAAGGSPAATAVARRIETSATVPLERLSARRLFGGEEHGYDPADRVRGGNQSVALALARRLGDRVRLSTPVVSVAHDGGGALVRCAGGEELRAAAVVLAVPLPLLLELEVDPGLPPAVAAAAGRTLFGDAAKLHVPLAGRPVAERVASPDALWWCWTSTAADGDGAAPVLSCFAGGDGAIAAMDEAGALALRPDAEPSGAPALRTHWGAEPWTRGSYSGHGIGSGAEDDAAWAEPWGSVVLAGEHTAGGGAGTMNGAVASGARAAAAVVARLRQRE
jgi:monoamine oxidase